MITKRKTISFLCIICLLNNICVFALPVNAQEIVQDKLVISGVVEDEHFDSISYRINNETEIKTINETELEDLGDNKKAFEIILDTQITPITKVEIIAKDKAGNKTSKIFEVVGNKVVTLKKQSQNNEINGINKVSEINGVRIIKNDGMTYQVRQGEPFELIGDLVICDDIQKSQNDGQAKLVINSNVFMINNSSSNINIGGSLLGSGLITTSTIGKLDGCRLYPSVFESIILNSNNTVTDLFNPNLIGNNPTLYWPLRTYTITQTLTANPGYSNLYGTTFENNSLSTTLTYSIQVIRDVEASIQKVEPKNLIYDKENTITFKLQTEDSAPFTEDKKPQIKNAAANIETPSGEKENNLNLNCNLTPNQTLPNRKLTYDCTFKYTPKEYTKEEKPYILNIPVEFPEENGDNKDNEDNGGKPQIVATTKLNFNLLTNESFNKDFESGNVFGPIYFYTAFSSASEDETRFSYSTPQKLILLDKPRINSGSGKLKRKIDKKTQEETTETKELTLSISNNTKTPEKYTLELKLEMYDALNNLLTTQTKKVKLTNEELSKQVTITGLPKETELVKVTLERSNNFLTDLKQRVKEEFGDLAASKLNDPRYKIADKAEYKVDGEVVTFCDVERENEGNKNVIFSYSQKSGKTPGISAEGYLTSEPIEVVPILNLNEIIDPTNRLTGAMSGTISFLIPDEWNNFDKVSFTITSGDESDSCELKIGDKTFFTESSKEEDKIKLPFVTNGTATILDDLALNIKSVSFPFSEELTLKDFKQLLKDLKLLSEDNNNGYDLETQEATYELLKIIDDLRCNQNQILDQNLKSQVTTTTFQCGISTSNYQEYILSSIKQNLPYVILIKGLTNVLKPIGLQSPLVDSNLPDSILFKAFANEEALLPLPPWVKVALGLGAYIVAATLNNQKTKLDYFEQVKDSTCTRVSGTIDRRFIIGKDLNNLDRMRTNTMAGISIDNSSTFKVNVTEPFPHIPQYPGFYSTCLPEGSHTITLQFNGQNTFSMSVTVPRTSLPIFVEPFVGGVFRKYGTLTAIPKIIDSKSIFSSSEGDVRSVLNPTGSGAYLTNLSLKPDLEASTSEIAEALRLYKSGTFELGDPNSKGELEPERAKAFIDLAVNTKEIYLDHNNYFPLQFVVPSSPISFGNPGELSPFILIDKLGIP